VSKAHLRFGGQLAFYLLADFFGYAPVVYRQPGSAKISVQPHGAALWATGDRFMVCSSQADAFNRAKYPLLRGTRGEQIAPSPFPGANSYFEPTDHWLDFRTGFLTALRRLLVSQVGPKYIARLEEHIYIRHGHGSLFPREHEVSRPFLTDAQIEP
jgi:hypothetical protein